MFERVLVQVDRPVATAWQQICTAELQLTICQASDSAKGPMKNRMLAKRFIRRSKVDHSKWLSLFRDTHQQDFGHSKARNQSRKGLSIAEMSQLLVVSAEVYIVCITTPVCAHKRNQRILKLILTLLLLLHKTIVAHHH